jgi:hypothetical protein
MFARTYVPNKEAIYTQKIMAYVFTSGLVGLVANAPTKKPVTPVVT